MSNPETQRYARNWDRIHRETYRGLSAAPHAKPDSRLKQHLFTLPELIGHIPQAELVLVRSALAGSAQKLPFDSARSASEMADSFDAQHEQLVSEVSNLTPEQWREEVEFHGRTLRRGVLLWFVTEH